MFMTIPLLTQQQKVLEQQHERLINWIEMLAVLPDESPQGHLRDASWKGALEIELSAVRRRLQIDRTEKCANSLLDLTKKLNVLRYL